MTRAEIQDWLTYWENGNAVNVSRILSFDQVYQARLYCPVMRVGVFAEVSDGQIWDALREMRARDVGEPIRIQLRRTKGWKMPDNTVKVDRSTPFGNDFTVEDYGDAETAVDMFDHDLDKMSVFHPENYENYLAHLRGKNLACWCKPDAPCHADVWLRRANELSASLAADDTTGPRDAIKPLPTNNTGGA